MTFDARLIHILLLSRFPYARARVHFILFITTNTGIWDKRATF